MFKKNERQRLDALNQYHILDTLPEDDFDEVTRIASFVCETPVAFISFIDDKRQWFKSKIGVDTPDVPRDIAFCTHAIQIPEQAMVVLNAAMDERFKHNPLTKISTPVIFCVSIPLLSHNGQPIGTLCVIDHRPRKINEHQLSTLKFLAKTVQEKLEAKKRQHEHEQMKKDVDVLRNAMHSLPDHLFIIDPDRMKFVSFNNTAIRELGYSREELLQMGPQDIEPLFTTDELRSIFQNVIHSKKGFGVIETIHQRKNGEEFAVQVHLTAFRKSASDTLVIASARDITQQKNTRTKLEQSERKYRDIFKFLPNVIVRTAVNGTIQMISPASLQLLGYEPEELIGESFIQFYCNRQDRERLVTYLQKHHSVYNYSVGMCCKDGTVKQVSINSHCYYDDDGRLAGFEGVLTDITELTNSKKEIETTKDFYESIMNSISVDIAVFDDQSRYRFINKHAVQDDALRKWMIGKNDREYCIHRNKELKIATIREEKHDVVKRTGKQLEWVEELTGQYGQKNYFLRMLRPFIDKNNSAYRVGYGMNITELKTAQLDLLEREENLQHLISNAPDAIIVINRKGKIIFWNLKSEEMFGWNSAAVEGHSLGETIIPERFRESHCEVLNRYVEDVDYHNSSSQELVAIKKNGEEFTVSISLSKALRNNKPVFIAFLRDITEKKKMMEEKLRRKKQLKVAQQIAKVCSYEWNTQTNEIEWSDELYRILDVEPNTEVMGGLFRLVHPEDRELVRQATNESAKNKKIMSVDFRIITPRGDTKYIAARSVDIKTTDESSPLIVGILQDMTEQKSLERRMLTAIIESEEKERSRIAAELHDGVCQFLATAKLTINTGASMLDTNRPTAIELINKSEDIVSKALTLTRKVSHDLAPEDLQSGCLIKAVETMVEELNRVDNIHYSVKVKGPVKAVNPITATNLFRILQEFIRNSQKYSGASSVTIGFCFNEEYLDVTAKDNGRGFDKDKLRGKGIGLMNMAKRVQSIGGSFTLKTSPGNGVSLRMKLPFN